MKTVDLHENLILAYTTAEDGNMDERFSDRSVVMVNRRKFLNQFDLHPKLTIEGKQVHADLILALDSENIKMWYGMNIPGVDGFVTNQKDVGMILKLADCVPVIMYDPVNHAIGVVHAGWQGAVKNIHVKGLQKMTETYGTDPKQVLVWLGPSAHQCHLASPEKPSQSEDPAWKKYIAKKGSGWQVDLLGFITESLNAMGVAKKRITIDSHCTVESEEFFSHIRSKQTGEPEGRFLVLAKLR